jgi:hypothetical protein
MKKIQLVILVVAIAHCCSGQNPYWKGALLQIAKNYFRSNPFTHEFDKFLDFLLNDPTLVSKTIQKRTDSNYFYLSGDYTTHNPFFFKPSRTQIILAETEIGLSDTTLHSSLMMIYQVAGYREAGKEGEKEVKDEYEQFDRKYSKKSLNDNYSEIKTGNEVTGALRNYFVFPNGFTPLTAAWQNNGKDKGNVFVVTIRFLVSDNHALIPVPANSP